MKITIKEFPTHIAKTNNKVKANKMIKINNQSIYNSNLNRFARNIVMTNLHEYLRSQIKPFKKELKELMNLEVRYPITIKLIIYTVRNHGSISMRSGKLCWKYPSEDYVPNWDIENLATMWLKAICDTLVIMKIIPDDNITFVKGIQYEYIEVEDLEDRKIEINIK